MENDELDRYEFDAVDVAVDDVPPERTLHHGTLVIEDIDPIWREEEHVDE